MTHKVSRARSARRNSGRAREEVVIAMASPIVIRCLALAVNAVTGG